MRLSILVVSRTARLLNSMLSSLRDAISLPEEDVEVLCSWNGDSSEETRIENSSGYEFLIANRDPYHFARNMNALAEKANGEVLLLINDDVLLDEQSIDKAMKCLVADTSTGLVSARLRDPKDESPMQAFCSTDATVHTTGSIEQLVLNTMLY